jgi:hypothetical protein
LEGNGNYANSKLPGIYGRPHMNSYNYAYPASFEPAKIPKYRYPIPGYSPSGTGEGGLKDKNEEYYAPPGTGKKAYLTEQGPYPSPPYGGKMDPMDPYMDPMTEQQTYAREFKKFPKFAGKEPPQESKEKLTVLDHFGIYPNVPTALLLKGCSIVLLIILVELNTWINLDTLHPILAENIGSSAVPFIGVSAIGLFLGILFRYMDFELYRLKLMPKEQSSGRFKSYLTLIFLLAITIFIVLEVIVELINARGSMTGAPGGALFLLDLLIILIVTLGTYAVFSKNRNLNIITIMFLFIIMMIGIDYGTNVPMMVVLGCLMLIYIEVTDGAGRIAEYIAKFHIITETQDNNEQLRNQIDNHMDAMAVQFLKNLAVFIGLTITITSILLLIFISYPYITPSFIHENLELQTVYALLPIIVLLFMIFLVYKLIMKYLTPPEPARENALENP